jgi:hypothetical protein
MPFGNHLLLNKRKQFGYDLDLIYAGDLATHNRKVYAGDLAIIYC